MTVWIYGDVTLDNYEYEYPGDVGEVYSEIEKLCISKSQLEGLIRPLRNRFVARQFGGAYLLARYIAVALSLWRWAERESRRADPADAVERLHELEPWRSYRNILRKKEDELAKDPKEISTFLQRFYRVSEDPFDHSYRVPREGQEGFTLPSRVSEGHLFACLIGAPSAGSEELTLDHEPTVSQCHDALVCVVNDDGARLWREKAGWLAKERWADDANRTRTWAVVKSNGYKVITADKAPSTRDVPPFPGELMRLLPNRVVLVVSADGLRQNGVAISRSLSWERCISDLVSEITRADIRRVEFAPHLVVVFDFDAALYLSTSRKGQKVRVEKAIFVLSKNRSEGGYRSPYHGGTPGARSIFTSVFAGLMNEQLLKLHDAKGGAEKTGGCDGAILDCGLFVEKLLTYALIAQQRFLKCGFTPPTKENLFRISKGDGNAVHLIPRLLYHEATFALPPVTSPSSPAPDEGSPEAAMPTARRPDEFSHPLTQSRQLKKDQAKYELSGVVLDPELFARKDWEIADVALDWLAHKPKPLDAFVEYVKSGKVRIENNEVDLPICTIGKIKTISSSEIAGLRTIGRLVGSYLARTDGKQTPLGLAVFGAPGTGKSFAVKSVFDTFSGRVKELIDGAVIECNLSGLDEPEELAAFFQRARDIRLGGKVPVLFFDEFDCSVDGTEYFWLKHFLAPLQDGVFSADRETHPIGKAIMVFAGSRKCSFSAFREECRKEGSDAAKAKGRDFISRLLGHLDVEGLSPPTKRRSPNEASIADHLDDPKILKFVMKRAILLRGILEKWVPSIRRQAGGGKILDIDDKVAEAFLCEEDYLHGVRSLEAIVRMSSIDGIARFSAECLPAKEQLEMHVSPRFYERAFGRG